jgi:uncharacterized protein YjbI with pentapeptide repeats
MILRVATANWLSKLPPATAGVSEFPICDEDDAFELLDVHIADASSAVALFLERPELVNVVLERCDVAGFGATEGRADRVLVARSRLRGVTWANGVVQDVELDGVSGSEVSFRFSLLRRVTLTDCQLPGLDFTETVFDSVRLERCDLTGARFDHAHVKSLRIEGCDLSECTGVEALSGASIHPDDLLAFGPSMARALGMTIE